MIAQLKNHNNEETQTFASVEAEELILGGILFDRTAIGKIENILESEHFYVRSHGTIYKTALELYRSGQPTDLMTVGNRLEEKGVLEQIGGRSRLAILIERTVSAANIEFYAQNIVRKYWECRELQNLVYKIPDWLSNPDFSPAQIQELIISQTQALKVAEGNKSAFRQTITQVKRILESDLEEGERNARLEELRVELKISRHDWKHCYIEPIKEELADFEKDTVKDDLETITDANSTSLNLYEILSPELAQPLLKLAEWLNIRPETYLTALLCGLSGVHSPQTKLIINADWDFEVNPNLFGAIVAPSSQKKSPVIKAMITKPLRALQNKAKEEYEKQLEEHNQLCKRYEEVKEKNKELLKEEFPEGQPKEPKLKVFYFTNTTSEGMLQQFSQHPDQSLLYLKDELAGIFKSQNQYRSGKGSDEEDLLSYYDGAGDTILRKGGQTIDLGSIPLSVFGSVQLEVIKKLLGDGNDSNGKWARFIFINQPLAPSQMSADGGMFDLQPLLCAIYEKMAGLAPQTYRLSHDAFKLYCSAYNEYEQKRCAISTLPAMGQVWGKSEGRVGKLAINLHCLKYICKCQPVPETIEVDTIQAAITMTNFYALQVQSLYAELGDSLPSNLAKVMELCKRNERDWLTARDVYQSLSTTIKKSVNADTIRDWFFSLRDLGKGIIEGAGKGLKFKIFAHNDHNDHNDHKPKINTEELTENNLPKQNMNVGNVGNVGKIFNFAPKHQQAKASKKDEFDEFKVGEMVEVNTATGWEKGEIIDFSPETGKPIIQIRGNRPRVHTAFSFENLRHL